LHRFYEGKSLSTAVVRQSKGVNTGEALWPFRPFAWATETKVDREPQPFVLFYDPPFDNASETAFEGRGPIVLYGGFAAAFAAFLEDGTEALIKNIASWLVRKEERWLFSVVHSCLEPTAIPFSINDSPPLETSPEFNIQLNPPPPNDAAERPDTHSTSLEITPQTQPNDGEPPADPPITILNSSKTPTEPSDSDSDEAAPQTYFKITDTNDFK
jgi:hypothetical protein